jgi:hypothetical protein
MMIRWSTHTKITEKMKKINAGCSFGFETRTPTDYVCENETHSIQCERREMKMKIIPLNVLKLSVD